MLNLLPSEIKDRYRDKSRVYSLALAYIMLLVLTGLSAAGLATWNYIQQANISNKQGQMDQLRSEKQSKNELTIKAAFVEDRVKSVSQFRENQEWEAILDNVAAATPIGVQLDSMKVSIAKAVNSTTITLGGATTDRRTIVLFRDKLASLDYLSDVALQTLNESEAPSGKNFLFTIVATYNGSTSGQTE